MKLVEKKWQEKTEKKKKKLQRLKLKIE